jgi:hypothetical protein
MSRRVASLANTAATWLTLFDPVNNQHEHTMSAKTNTTPANEWQGYCKLFNGGATRQQLIDAARKMRDADNRKAALLNLGFSTAKDRREIEARWRSINAVTQAEINAHCQFAGLPNL